VTSDSAASRSRCANALRAIREALDEARRGLDVWHQLRQLRDRHAVVGHPLEVQIHVQNREDQTQVARDRRLPREQRLDALLDRDVPLVDVVVERDHLVGQFVVPLLERVERTTKRPEDEVALLVQRRLEQVEVVLECGSHPNRPVT
jgi:hypothetical protein